jgi:hypothetical protein
MRSLLKISTLGAALVLAPGLAQAKEISEVRDLDEFSKIVIESSADVDVTVGGSQRVEVFAEDDEISDVKTEVRGDTLYVSFKDQFWGHHDVRLNVSVRNLDGIEIDGSGDVSATGVKSDNFEIEIDGSGNVDLEGSCGALTINVDGSGDINSKNLECQSADVEIDGSGDVDVFAENSLVLEIDGSGDVTVYGDPDNVRPRISGSGDLRFVDGT